MTKINEAGKGDTYRPYSKREWDKAYDRIFGVLCPRCKGIGTVIKTTGNTRDDVAYDIKCYKCKGKGRVYK